MSRLRPRTTRALAAATSVAVAVLVSFASLAVAASPARLPSTNPHKSCPQVSIPQIYPGYDRSGIGPQEVDLYGRGWPSCSAADHLLRVAPKRIPEHRWGLISGWRCVWEVSYEECKRGDVRVFAVNPGD